MNATKSQKVRYYRPKDKLKFQFHVQGAHIEVFNQHQIQYHLRMFLENNKLINGEEMIAINFESCKLIDEKLQLEPFSENRRFHDAISFEEFSDHVMKYSCYQITEDQADSIYPTPPDLISLEELLEEESEEEKLENKTPEDDHSSKSQTIAEWANQRGLRQVPVPPKYLGWEFPEKVLRPKPHSREQLTNQSKEGGFRKIDSGIFSSSEYQQNEHLVGCSQETLDLPDSLDFPDCGNSQVGKDDFDDSCRGDDVYRQKVRVSQKDLKAIEGIQLSQQVPVHPMQCCPICMKREVNGVLVHGKFAHAYACFNCSMCLLRDENCCPVCRLPILFVTKVFV